LTDRPDRLAIVLGAIAAAAWGVLALSAGGVVLPAFCAPAALWGPPALSLDLALTLNPPATLAAGWALMLAAMMPPLIAAPLRHIRARSPARQRARAMLSFAAGYAAAWMAAAAALQAAALAARLAAPGSLLPLAVAAAIALLWQVSPAKQSCLKRLAAFGGASDRDALRFGLAHGGWCVGACWALMLLPPLVLRGHLPAMAAVALLLFAERLDRPAPLARRRRVPGLHL